MRQVTIREHLARAQAGSRFIEAPPAAEHRPALVFRVADAAEPVIVPWKGSAQLPGSADTLITYGPRNVPLPFTVTLTDFRKLDYPGTEMAMAYESDVSVTSPDAADQNFRVFMNNPYAQGPWKVYQSGFIGDDVSVFSVMKDPGLPLTYIGCIALCVGIFITFYSRSLSWGHPGIPIEFGTQENTHAPSAPRPAPAAPAAPRAEPAHAGV
jgi:cytochrome c biogenesis protein ResB